MSGETEAETSGWTVDTLRAHTDQRFADLTRLLDERAAAQQEALLTAFTSAQTAIDARATTLDKEFHEHLLQYRHETSLVLEAADKAITKSETAVEKRFEGVNEFRAQLNDQAQLFMPRTESDASIDRLTERVQELTDRMNRSEGSSAGVRMSAGVLAGAIAAIAAIVVVVNVVLALATGSP